MAYRFTDTGKWDDNWFSELKPLSKLLFLYLCDQCDIAGFLELNIRKISFDLGIGKQEVEKSLKEVETRILYSLDGRFLFVKNFLKHQKNLSLNEKNNAHRGIIDRLQNKLELFGFEDISNFIISPSQAPNVPLPWGTGKGKGNSEGNRDIGGTGGKEKTWREDYQVYLDQLRGAYKALVNDKSFIEERQRYHPGLDIKLSLEKACKDYWSQEVGWKKKKASKSGTIDWKSTLKKALDLKTNQVWKTKEQMKNETEQRKQPTIVD